MNEIRVGVRVSGADGARMARSLEAAGFRVSRLEPESAEAMRARVVVVEVASPDEVGDALREWRTTSSGAPPTVVLIGPADADPEPYAAADAFFRRPVPISELVRIVRGFLSADRASRGHEHELFAGEPTVRVENEGERTGEAATRQRTTSSGDVRAGTSPGGRHRTEARSRLSPALEGLLLAADRRLFPDAAALPFDMPGADARPAELVPDELLASPMSFSHDSPPFGTTSASFEHPPAESEPPGPKDSTDPLFADPLHVGPGFAELAYDAALGPEPLATTAFLERRPASAVAVTPLAGETSGAALLLSVADRPSPHRLSFRDADGHPISAVLTGGAVVSFEGPVDACAARRLHAEGRLAEAPPPGDESAFLEALAQGGHLRGVDLTRARRESIEAFVAAFARTSAVDVQIEEADDERATPPLTRAVKTIVLDAFRAASSGAFADHDAFHLRDGARAALTSFGLLPEELATLEALAGVPFVDLRARAHGVRGLEGLVALAVELGLAGVAPASPTTSHPPTVSAVRVHLANAAARAADGSYFEILGVPADADGDVIARAHDRLTRELAALDLVALGLPGLERDREQVLEAVDEAYSALRSARLRRAYAAALAAPEVGR